MILLDATALVAALVGEPAAQEVKEILAGGEAAIVATNLAESVDVLVRVFDNELEDVEAKLVPLLATSLPVRSVGESEARRAAEIRIDYYHRRDRPLSLADCLLLGSALLAEASIVTSDVPTAQTGRDLDLEVVALKGSDGIRP